MARYFEPTITVDYEPLGTPPAGSVPALGNIPATQLKPWHAFNTAVVAQARYFDLQRFICDARPFEGYNFVNADYLVYRSGGWRFKYRIQVWHPWTTREDGSIESFMFTCYLWEPPVWEGP